MKKWKTSKTRRTALFVIKKPNLAEKNYVKNGPTFGSFCPEIIFLVKDFERKKIYNKRTAIPVFSMTVIYTKYPC